MIKRIQVSFVLLCFVFNMGLPSYSFAQSSSGTFLNLPAPGSMLSTSPAFTPAIVRGLQIDPKNPLQFNFIVDTGDARVQGDELRAESSEMIKYFLTALTVPEKELWVNLSPYEKDRIIANGLGQTDMGRDMLAQDYILKQLTASLIYPEGSIGKEFWAKVYKIAQEKYGNTQVPVNTFNKVWIVPSHATIYEHNGTAFITENKLKVMLEQDYLSLQKHMNNTSDNVIPAQAGIQNTSTLGSQIIREIVLPELEKEVNTGKNFAQLRQIANAVVLATWYKMNLKQSLLGQVYANQNKVAGVDAEDKNVKMEIYNQYLKAFKKGVYNFIKEDVDPLTNQTVSRKYFSGGLEWEYAGNIGTDGTAAQAMKVAGDHEFETVRWAASGILANATPAMMVNQAMVAGDVTILGQFGDNITDIEGKGTGTSPIQDMIRHGMKGAIVSHSEVLEELTKKSKMFRNGKNELIFKNLDANDNVITTDVNREIFAPQVKIAFDNGLNDIIVAVGETATEREQSLLGHNLNKVKAIIRKDITSRLELVRDQIKDSDNAKRFIIAYEPRWAIGGVAMNPEETQEIAAFIRQLLASEYGDEVAQKVRILYGGAANGKNAKSFMDQKDIDGLLVGGQSLSVETAEPILNALQEAGREAVENQTKNGRIPYFGANWKTDPVKSPFVAFGELFKKYDTRFVTIGVGPKNTEMEQLRAALQVGLSGNVEQLNYNKDAVKKISENFKTEAINEEDPILAAIAALARVSRGAMTVRRSLTTSSQVLPPTTVVGPDGKIKLVDKDDSIHVSEGLSADEQTSLIFVPGQRGKVAHQMTIVFPTQANITADALASALKRPGIDVRALDSSEGLNDSDKVVIDKPSVSVKQADGMTQIDLNLWYDVGTKVDTNVKLDDPNIVKDLGYLTGSRQEPSRSIQPNTTGLTKNLFINGANGQVGSQIIRQWLLAGPDSGINIVLGNGAPDANVMIKALQEDSVHGSFLKRGRDDVNLGTDENGVEFLEFTYKGHTFNKLYLLNNRGEYAKLPIGDYDAEIAVDAIKNGETSDNLHEYIEAGAIKVIHTSPSKKGVNVKKAFGLVFGVSDHYLDGQDLCDTASCTTNSVAPAEAALMQEGGIESEEQIRLDEERLTSLGETYEPRKTLKTLTAHVRTVHASTGSDNVVDSTKRKSALKNMRLEKTGASGALPGLLDDLKGVPMSADALRVPVANMSISEVTKVVAVAEGQTLSIDDVKKAFIRASTLPNFEGKLDVIQGGFDSKQLLGSSASATILLDSIEVVKIKGPLNRYMVHYKSWYDNVWGFSARVWDTVLAVAEDINVHPPQAGTVEELLDEVDHYNSKIPSGVMLVTPSVSGIVKVEVINRIALTAQYGLLDYLVKEAQFNPNEAVRQTADQIIRQAANSLGIQSASRQNIKDTIVSFKPGTGSGSNYMAMQQFAKAARDTSTILSYDIVPAPVRVDKKQPTLTPETKPVTEPVYPTIQDYEPGFVPSTIAAGYAAAIKANYRGLVLFNLGNVEVNPGNFTPVLLPAHGKAGFEKYGNPLDNAKKYAKEHILEAAKAGAFNFEVDLTPVLAYGEKNIRATKSKLSYVVDTAVELTRFVRDLENQIGYFSQPLSISFTFAKGTLKNDDQDQLESDIEKTLNEEELEPPSFIGEKPSETSIDVQNTVLREIVKLSAGKGNVKAVRLRNEMINFMEGLIFRNEVTSEDTKSRLQENKQLSPGGQRYNRHRLAWMKALELGRQKQLSLDRIFNMILSNYDVETLLSTDKKKFTSQEKATLDQLVEIMYRVFREDIFNFTQEDHFFNGENGFKFDAKREIDIKSAEGTAHKITEAVNAGFRRDPRKPLPAGADKYQQYYKGNAEVTEYQEPAVTAATMELHLDQNGALSTEVLPDVATSGQKVVNSVRGHFRVAMSQARGSRMLRRREIMNRLREAFPSKTNAWLNNLAAFYQGRMVLSGTGQIVILPIDQAIEHSPTRTHLPYPPMADPKIQVELAVRLGLNGFAALPATIEYISREYSDQIPLIYKVNESSAVLGEAEKGFQRSYRVGEVESAFNLGAKAIGYTIQPGTFSTAEVMDDLRQVVNDANRFNLPVIVWAYARGGLIPSAKETAIDVGTLAAHIAIQAGAAIVKIKPTIGEVMNEKDEKKIFDAYPDANNELFRRIEIQKFYAGFGDNRDFIYSGGEAKGTEAVLDEIAQILFGGGNGNIVGRNMFQRSVDDAADLGNSILALNLTKARMEAGEFSFKTWKEFRDFALNRKTGGILYDVIRAFKERNPDWVDYKARVEATGIYTNQSEVPAGAAKGGVRSRRDRPDFDTDGAQSAVANHDAAMKREGGINFDPAMYSIQIKRDGNGFPLPMDQQPIARINVRGFRGIIMSITPANLPVMLGLAHSTQQLAMNS